MARTFLLKVNQKAQTVLICSSLREIEIRFQFQPKQNNREGRDRSSLNLTIEHGCEQGNGEFMVTGDREASASAVFSGTAHHVC
jgi:hypothetical protein